MNRFLEKNGALWHHIPFSHEASVIEKNRAVFKALVKEVFGADKASEVLGSVTVGDPPELKEKTGFSYFKKEVDFFLELGANLNGVSSEHPEFGTILHRYLAYESPFGVELIDFLESKRVSGKPHTHFNYCQRDGLGNTPLMIAIATRNSRVVFKLLGLSQKLGIDVGLNIPNNDGQTPLMLACAFGLPIVVQALLRQKVNLDLVDNQKRTYRDYLQLVSAEQIKILSMLVNPERGSQVNHSYVYASDSGKSPYCVYSDEETLVAGETQRSHFVVLSHLPQHQARIQIILEKLQLELARAKKLKSGKEAAVSKIQGEIDFVLHQNRQVLLPSPKTFLEESQAGIVEVLKFLDSGPGKAAVEEAKREIIPVSGEHEPKDGAKASKDKAPEKAFKQ